MANDLEYVFFDIGGTLAERAAVSGTLVPLPSTSRLSSFVQGLMGLKK
jgi:hypothetical protein